MFTAKLKPTRLDAQADPQMEVVCDFDLLEEKKIGFKYHGKVYQLGKLTVKNYMRVTLAYRDLLAVIAKRSQGDILSEDTVCRTYYNLISSICPEFPYEELITMSFEAFNYLFMTLMKKVGADPSFLDSEKKNPLNPMNSLTG